MPLLVLHTLYTLQTAAIRYTEQIASKSKTEATENYLVDCKQMQAMTVACHAVMPNIMSPDHIMQNADNAIMPTMMTVTNTLTLEPSIRVQNDSVMSLPLPSWALYRD